VAVTTAMRSACKQMQCICASDCKQCKKRAKSEGREANVESKEGHERQYIHVKRVIRMNGGHSVECSAVQCSVCDQANLES
jgi:hypothetical protein